MEKRMNNSLEISLSRSQMPIRRRWHSSHIFNYFESRALLKSLKLPLSFVFAVVQQFYQARVIDEFVLRGNSATLKCNLPSFVADFVSIESWISDDGIEILPNNDDFGLLDVQFYRTLNQYCWVVACAILWSRFSISRVPKHFHSCIDQAANIDWRLDCIFFNLNIDYFMLILHTISSHSDIQQWLASTMRHKSMTNTLSKATQPY